MTRDSLAAYSQALARLALGLTIVVIPFRLHWVLKERPQPPVYGDYLNFSLYLSDVGVLMTLALWAISLLLRRNARPLRLGPLFLSGPLAGLVGLGWLSAIFSVDPALSLYHALRLTILLALYFFVINEIESPRFIGWPVALQVLIQAVVGLGQALSQRSLGLEGLGEWTLNPEWNGVSIVWAEGVRSLRAYGLSDHPNILGGCLALGLIGLGLWHGEAPERWRAPLVGALFALGATGLLLTFSRAAWLALGAGVGLILILLARARQTRLVLDWLGLLAAALLLVLPLAWHNAAYLGARLNVQNSFSTNDAEMRSLGERPILNEAVSRLFAEHPLTGVGLGTLPRALHLADPNFPLNYQPAHIIWLDVAAELGLPGALCYFLVLGLPWLALGWRLHHRLELSPELIGMSGALLAITVIGFFDYYPWLLVPGRLWQWLVWGLLGAAFQAQTGPEVDHA